MIKWNQYPTVAHPCCCRDRNCITSCNNLMSSMFFFFLFFLVQESVYLLIVSLFSLRIYAYHFNCCKPAHSKPKKKIIQCLQLQIIIFSRLVAFSLLNVVTLRANSCKTFFSSHDYIPNKQLMLPWINVLG